MHIKTIAFSFFIGVMVFQLNRELPSIFLFLFLPVGAFIFVYCAWSRPFLIAVLGFFWAYLYALLLLTPALHQTHENQLLPITGKVIQVDRQNSRYQRLILKVDAHQNTQHRLPDKLQLTWYFGDFLISPHSHCELLVRLKRFNRYANPGGFDYEKLMFIKGINARGTIKQAQCKSSIKHGLRANLIDRFENEYKTLENFGLMLALTWLDFHCRPNAQQ